MQPIPSVVAILLCDRIITEAETFKKTLVGVFKGVSAPQTPVSLQMAFYAQMTDAEGGYSFRIDVVRLETNQLIAQGKTSELNVPDRLSTVDLAINLPQVQFPGFGKYEFQLFANEIYVAHISLNVKQLERSQ